MRIYTRVMLFFSLSHSGLQVQVKSEFAVFFLRLIGLGYNRAKRSLFPPEEGFSMKIAIGADHAGYRLKDVIVPYLESLGHEVKDVGCNCEQSVDYPDYAVPVCDMVLNGQADKGILICGTGIGMTIAANKMPGIRCALVHDMFSAKATREHNDTNVLAMGERVIGPGVAQEIVKIWIETEFSHGERHENRLKKVKLLEEKNTIHP